MPSASPRRTSPSRAAFTPTFPPRAKLPTLEIAAVLGCHVVGASTPRAAAGAGREPDEQGEQASRAVSRDGAGRTHPEMRHPDGRLGSVAEYVSHAGRRVGRFAGVL